MPNHNHFDIEPLRHGDEVAIQRIFDGMSPEARFHRFMTAMPVLKPGLRRILADVDGDRHRAWIAKVDERPVGVVRIIEDQFGDLELAVSVVDAMHRRGIGSGLVGHALREAAAADHEDVVVMIHPENQASIKMFRRLGAQFRFDFGLLVGRVPTRVMEVAA